MAFDMFFIADSSKTKEKINHSEEFIFHLLDGNNEYPEINLLWENFYNGPEIDSERSNRLVHELLKLKNEFSKHNQYKLIQFIVDRLLIFFSIAYTKRVIVTCISD